MKTKHILIVAAAIFASGILHYQADAAISITNFNLTTNSVTFNISGTLPINPPPEYPSVLYFVNPNPDTVPGFALGSFMSSGSSSFTGTQALRATILFPVPGPSGIGSSVTTGSSGYGDYFYLAFASDLTAGEAVSGTVTAAWSGTAFDPTVVGNLNVYWGANDIEAGPLDLTAGTFLTTTSAVPEPSATLLAALGSLALLRRTRRK